jgi:ABC-type bacteriocin/lantibiotic exporters, contain an N-terminal double-glycine peptidase domain
MIAVVLYLLRKNDNNVAAIIPTLGVYALASLRLLPAIQALYEQMNLFRFGGAVVENMSREMDSTRRPDTVVRPSGDPLHLRDKIVIDGVSYTYPDAQSAALQGVSLEIKANTTIGVVGGSGAGKSTLVDLLLGLITPSHGAIHVDGAALDEATIPRWRRSVGYVAQTLYILDGSVAENIAFGIPKGAIDMAAVERAARAASLHEFVSSDLPEGYATQVGEDGKLLSGGQRQRLAVARALYNDPDVLMFDEATSALDNVTERQLMDAIYSLAKTKQF